jgi:hypothetical protein
MNELLALWCILSFVVFKKVKNLHLVEDLKIIIDWFLHLNNLEVVSLEPWMSKIHALSGKFHHLKAQHIYREYNKEAYHLSKIALQMEEEGIYFAVGMEKQI